VVAIISDTHDNLPAIREALQAIREQGASVIIHAGDIISPFAFRLLLSSRVAFYGVYGNNDGERAGLASMAREGGAVLVPQPLALNIEGVRFLIMHGVESPDQTKRLVDSLASNSSYDVLVYGHTHEAEVRELGEKMVINPGELCGYLTGKRTMVLLDTASKRAQMVEL